MENLNIFIENKSLIKYHFFPLTIFVIDTAINNVHYNYCYIQKIIQIH